MREESRWSLRGSASFVTKLHLRASRKRRAEESEPKTSSRKERAEESEPKKASRKGRQNVALNVVFGSPFSARPFRLALLGSLFSARSSRPFPPSPDSSLTAFTFLSSFSHSSFFVPPMPDQPTSGLGGFCEYVMETNGDLYYRTTRVSR